MATTQAMRVKLGLAKSCGCLTRTHGFSKHPLYQLWASVIQRCTNPNHASYHRYGGRGITVCDRWRLDPWLFAEDIYREIGPRPEGRDETGRVLYELDRTTITAAMNRATSAGRTRRLRGLTSAP